MPEIRYDNVAPLVAQSSLSGRMLTVVFRCPVQSTQVTARAPIQAQQQTAQKNQMSNMVQRTVMNELRWGLSRTLRSALGGGVAGRMASQVAYTAMDSAKRQQSQKASQPSAADQQQAIVEAFHQVADQFVWDGQRWIGAGAAGETMSPFLLQLRQAPMQHPYDRLTACRMLVEIAAADGELAREEEALLVEFLDAESGGVRELAQRPPLTSAELGQTSAGAVRHTMLMIAWVLALSDESFDAAEQQKLTHFAQGLGLRGAQEQAATDAARGHVLDQAMERLFVFGPHTAEARQRLYDMARNLGIDDDTTQTLEARFLRRQGM
jgi:hypothetical protein